MLQIAVLLILVSEVVLGSIQGPANRGRRSGSGAADPRDQYHNSVPDHHGSIVLARPTDTSITLSMMLGEATSTRLLYGLTEELGSSVGPIEVAAGKPAEVALEGLQPDALYHYRLVDAESGEPLLPEPGGGVLRTQRASGAEFTFTITADSHLDGFTSPELYSVTLGNIRDEAPDFHIDLGDVFMTGKIADRGLAIRQYEVQRYYMGIVGQSAPLFLAIGNHDGEEARRTPVIDGEDLAAWSCRQRKRFFPNPVPDSFYSGNAEAHPDAGLLQDYYSWEWGDALFVVLDPYWHSQASRGGRSPWNASLGRSQYDWLARTLRESGSRFKFVFIHQLVGGADESGRGGIEAASLFEWGGLEKDGTSTFAANRPEWDKPIHDLLVETGVSIVFHGHDHFFARQELDGVVYQLAPQPAHQNFRNHQAAEYGYKEGDFLPNSGHLRVWVRSTLVEVDYVRSATQDMERHGIRNGEVAFSYACAPR